MAEDILTVGIPVSECLLRDFSKNPARSISTFTGKEQDFVVKNLHDVVGRLLDTADIADLSASHRAAATNALCAAVDFCQASNLDHVRNAILEDSVWFRLFGVYLERSGNAKGKSMRQMLLTLTNVLLKNPGSPATRLRNKAASTLVGIICHRNDRLKVKPALQGLAHFLQKDVVSISDLVELYRHDLSDYNAPDDQSLQDILRSFLSWIVHHDTSLSAGHLLKSFFTTLRRSSMKNISSSGGVWPLWIEPVVEMLHQWKDRIQEFKTHVFPSCFLANLDEYLRFLSYLHFATHIPTTATFPDGLRTYHDRKNDLQPLEEFEILLAALQTGKELSVVRDVDYQDPQRVSLGETCLLLPDRLYGMWLSSPEPEVRLAGLFLSVYSTAVTKPVTGGILKSLKRSLPHLHTETDANFRKELLNHVQKLFDRLKGSTSTIVKSLVSKNKHEDSRISFSIYSARTGTHTLSRSYQHGLVDPLEFMLWYIYFLEWELRPTSSYQRRITALRSLAIVLKSGLDPNVPYHHLSKSAQGQLRWAHGLPIVTPRLLRSLLDLVLDPFDDVRAASAALVELCLEALPNDEKKGALSRIPPFLDRAETMMLKTGRADEADGVARTYSLLFSQCTIANNHPLLAEVSVFHTNIEILARLTSQLEQTIAIAQHDLSKAVNGRPVHGTFAAIRYIIDQESFYTNTILNSQSDIKIWKEIHGRVLTCFQDLWACIRHVLCADAPEGHVPEEFEEEARLDTKEILSYSWRALKEASILVRTVVSKAPIGEDDRSFLRPEEVQKLGELCFSQLVELRHRGAFATVAQTFASFCRRCMVADSKSLQALPEGWYQETLLCIQDKASSITRRSAGIPSLLTGIVAAEQPPGGPFFIRAIRDLKAEASQPAQSSNIEESRLPQVHALNCIKEIFMTSKLSVASESYIGEGLDLAARTLNSNIWPIRNCSLMLFKALIERLLGSDEAQDWKDQDRSQTSRFSYSNYPSLLDILSSLLDPSGPLQQSMEKTTQNTPMDLHGAEGVFPALQILRQAPPPDSHRPVFIRSIFHLLGSPHWHLRDMAARTIVSFYRPHEFPSAVNLLGEMLEGDCNPQHGLLLTSKYLLRKYSRSDLQSNPDLIPTVSKFLEQAQNLYILQNNPFTKAAFVDLTNLWGLCLIKNHLDREPGTWMEPYQNIAFYGHSEGQRTLGDALLQRSIKVQGVTRSTISKGSDSSRPNTGSDKVDVLSSLKDLEQNDPDTCCEILDFLDSIRQTTGSKFNAHVTASILHNVYQLVILAQDNEVRSRSQSVLANALVIEELRASFFSLVQEEDVLRTIEVLERECLEGSPSNVQSALRLQGYFLDYAFHSYTLLEPTMYRRIGQYLRLMRMTIVDTKPFDARFAAVESVSALHHILTIGRNSKSRPLILALSFVLYDMLNDDDDEIRDSAAGITAKLLQAQGFRSNLNEAVPVITVHRLLRFLVETCTDSRDLRKECLRRLMGVPSSRDMFLRSFAHILSEARTEDTALFSLEKQNLYKDDILDVALWASALKSLPPGTIPHRLSLSLAKWTLEGLVALTETARGEVDGPLGWTGKDDVFTLGMRVICATDVLLKWNVGDAPKLKLALRAFADAGAESGVHGLWLERAERVLEGSVLDTLKGVYRSIPIIS